MCCVAILQGDQDSALAMYDKVVDSWYKHLAEVKAASAPESVMEMSEAMAAEVADLTVDAATQSMYSTVLLLPRAVVCSQS